MKTSIIVKTQFEGTHCWPRASGIVGYLAQPHRHRFFVEVEMTVHHNDRELEFFLVKHFLDSQLEELSFDLGEMSCEDLCVGLLSDLKKKYGSNRDYTITILEDNENGARVVAPFKYEPTGFLREAT